MITRDPGVIKRRLMASTSTMEMSNMSMPDISEEDVVQMDTPGYYLGNLTLISKWFNRCSKHFLS